MRRHRAQRPGSAGHPAEGQEQSRGYWGLMPWGRALRHPPPLNTAMAQVLLPPDPLQWPPVCLVPFLEPNPLVLTDVHHVGRWEVPKKAEQALALSHTALSAIHAIKHQWGKEMD